MESEILAYKCRNCGANLKYSAQSRDFWCEYCGGHFTAQQLDAPLEGSSTESTAANYAVSNEQDDFDNNRLYLCPSCGAAVMTDSELDASAECFYCHSPVVLSGRLSGEFRPDKLIPFKKTREDAINGFKQWTEGKRRFLAKGFGSDDSLRRIQGIYIPFWMADCCVEGGFSADAFQHVSSVRSGDYIVNTEKKYIVDRKGSIIFNGVLADGSTKADDALMDSIEPFDYNELIDFDMSYLSGHSAIRYDVASSMVQGRIEKRVYEATSEEFRSTAKGYTKLNVNSENYHLQGINWKNAMLPMWFMTYYYKGQMYYYAMNGQTGKFGGTLPVNRAKLALYSFGISVLIGAIAAFILGVMGLD